MSNQTLMSDPRDNGHLVDECDECHDFHHSPLEAYRTCSICEDWLKERADQAAYEMHFTVEDVIKAEAWANANRYRYDNPEHLLLDAFREKVIKADHWKAI